MRMPPCTPLPTSSTSMLRRRRPHDTGLRLSSLITSKSGAEAAGPESRTLLAEDGRLVDLQCSLLCSHGETQWNLQLETLSSTAVHGARVSRVEGGRGHSRVASRRQLLENSPDIGGGGGRRESRRERLRALAPGTAGCSRHTGPVPDRLIRRVAFFRTAPARGSARRGKCESIHEKSEARGADRGGVPLASNKRARVGKYEVHVCTSSCNCPGCDSH